MKTIQAVIMSVVKSKVRMTSIDTIYNAVKKVHFRKNETITREARKLAQWGVIIPIYKESEEGREVLIGYKLNK